MKAMLYVDGTNLWKMGKSLLFVLIVFAASAFLWSGPTFFNMIVVMISIMMPATLCAADKASGWDRMSLSMPILRRDVIGSKFLICALFSCGTLALSCVLAVIYRAIHPAGLLVEDIAALLLCEAIALVLMGVTLVAAIKWGVEKARYIMIGCVWVPILFGFLVSKMGLPKPDLSWLQRLEQSNVLLLAAFALIVGLVVYLLCCALSVHIYRKVDL